MMPPNLVVLIIVADADDWLVGVDGGYDYWILDGIMISMNGLKTKFRRINYWFRHNFWTVENVVLMIAISLCLVWTYQSIAAMSRNWELSERLTNEKKELELVDAKLKAAELENEYYKTDEYLELLARKNLDKQLPGEKMVVMPENSNEAKEKHKQVYEEKPEKEYSNIEKWMMFLFPSY